MSIALAATLHDTTGALRAETRRRLPALRRLYPAGIAVATSPKMKWLSRSRKFRWPEQISGLTTSTERAAPFSTELTAACRPKVAELQATFMS